MCPPNRYLKDADEKGVEPVAERVYRRVLTQKVFTKYRKDHCMCTTCLRTGWRGTHVHIYNPPTTHPLTYTLKHTLGILESGKKVILSLDKLDIWPVETTAEGEQVKRTPTTMGMFTRLKRLWDFIRLELHLHMEWQSPIAAHCTRLHLGSLSEPRFNTPCTHKHPNPTHPRPARDVVHEQSATAALHSSVMVRQRLGEFLGSVNRVVLSSTCTKLRSQWSQETATWPETKWQAGHHPPTCDTTHDGCCVSACKSKATHHCRHCHVSLCRKHCTKDVCGNKVPKKLPTSFGPDFVCSTCSPIIDSCQHSNEGCATCNEVYYFKQETFALTLTLTPQPYNLTITYPVWQDLLKMAMASDDPEIIGRAKDVIESIDIMVGHTARIANQERYWPEQLDKLRKSMDFTQVTLIPH